MTRSHHDSLWQSTRNSLLSRARGPGGVERDGAWQQLVSQYRRPITACVRRHVGRHPEADEIVDEFFSYLFDREVLAGFDPTRGRFRAFVQGVIRRFVLARRRRMAGWATHGGDDQLELLAVELPPEAEVDDERAWARALVDGGLDALRSEHPRDARLLLAFYGLDGRAPRDGPALATAHELSLAAVQKALSRARAFLREAIERAIAELVVAPEDYAAEKAALIGRIREAAPGLLGES